MKAVVKFGDVEATLEEDGWVCADPELEKKLNHFTRNHDPFGYDPCPTHTDAHEAARRFGGEVIHIDPVPRVRPGLVY